MLNPLVALRESHARLKALQRLGPVMGRTAGRPEAFSISEARTVNRSPASAAKINCSAEFAYETGNLTTRRTLGALRLRGVESRSTRSGGAGSPPQKQHDPVSEARNVVRDALSSGTGAISTCA